MVRRTSGKMANVTHHPNVHDMREVYGRARIILMPSLYESYGRVAVEALATGIPSIVAPTLGSRKPWVTLAPTPAALRTSYRRLNGSLVVEPTTRLLSGLTARSEELWAQFPG